MYAAVAASKWWDSPELQMLPSFPISSRIAKPSFEMAELETAGDETIELRADSKRKQSEDFSGEELSSWFEEREDQLVNEDGSKCNAGGIPELRK